MVIKRKPTRKPGVSRRLNYLLIIFLDYFSKNLSRISTAHFGRLVPGPKMKSAPLAYRNS
jgi:hypothetical protein